MQRAKKSVRSRLAKHIDNVDISYADQRDPLIKRSAVRTIEFLTGGRKLADLYREHQRSSNDNESFWEAAVRLLELKLDLKGKEIPKTGPLVVVANHPFGIIDGIIINQIISQVRPDFKIIAHGILTRAPEAAAQILPIDFGTGREAVQKTLETRKQALQWLADGHVLAIFPAGGVSTTKKPFDPAIDARWRPFTGKLIQSAKAPVLPIYFKGSNSRMFHIATHLSDTLRLSLFINEVHRKIGDRIIVRVGEMQPFEELAAIKDRQALVDKLFLDTYALGHIYPDLEKVPAAWLNDFR